MSNLPMDFLDEQKVRGVDIIHAWTIGSLGSRYLVPRNSTV
ncbi:MAG: hypothetical protein P0111_14670 [Nitrospira sp.]|nr:hypothetical protein [Nitrospira sp.]